MIKDDPQFLQNIFLLIKSDPDAVMFSFGGIGSTPDDFTRQVAAMAFTGQEPVRHKQAAAIITQRLGERAFPHPIKMADIPVGSKLVENPVNQMPGFQLNDRFFFMPGFPEMAHPMISNILDEFYPQSSSTYSCNFIVECSEARLIDIMTALPAEIVLSCLPSCVDGQYRSEIFLSHEKSDVVERWCAFFKDELDAMSIKYTVMF